MIGIRRAGFDDCMAFAGARGPMRRYAVAMCDAGDAWLLSDAEGPIALAFMVMHANGVMEFCLGLKPRARVHMRELCRSAQLILRRMAEDVPIVCYVAPGNRSGERMARIVGFVPDPDHSWRWILRAETWASSAGCSAAAAPA